MHGREFGAHHHLNAGGWKLGAGSWTLCSPHGPLVDYDFEVVELLDGGFNVAADGGAFFPVGQGGFGDGDDAAVAPGCRGKREEGFGQVGGADLEFLAAGGIGAE